MQYAHHPIFAAAYAANPASQKVTVSDCAGEVMGGLDESLQRFFYDADDADAAARDVGKALAQWMKYKDAGHFLQTKKLEYTASVSLATVCSNSIMQSTICFPFRSTVHSN